MLQEFSSPPLREASPCVLETERLSLRRPTLADVKAIARLANDRRIAENTRRLPHPYRQEHAVEFVRFLASEPREVAFLVEHNFEPIGFAGLDYFFEEFDHEHLVAGARVANPASRNVLEKCGFQWTGVELHRIEALGSSTPVDRFRLSRGVWSSLKNWGSSVRRER